MDGVRTWCGYHSGAGTATGTVVLVQVEVLVQVRVLPRSANILVWRFTAKLCSHCMNSSSSTPDQSLSAEVSYVTLLGNIKWRISRDPYCKQNVAFLGISKGRSPEICLINSVVDPKCYFFSLLVLSLISDLAPDQDFDSERQIRCPLLLEWATRQEARQQSSLLD
jgi:hypothetical protein